MKVVYLDHAPYEGGAEVSLKELVLSMDASVERIVLSPLAAYTKNFSSKGVTHIQFDYRWKGYVLLVPLLADVFKLARKISEIKPDIVHTNTRVTNVIGGLLSLLRLLPPNTKLINHVRDKDPLPSWKFRLIGSCDWVIANSQQVKQFLMEGGVPESKITVIYNGVDVKKFSVTAKRPLGSCRILFVGQIYPRKGVEYLIRAFPLILREFPDATLKLVGQDPTKEQKILNALKTLAEEVGVEKKVEWLGYRDDIPELLASSDAFVLPSLEEPFGRVLIEAMATRVPVVATHVGGIPEIVVHGETGFLVPARDAEALAEKIILLLDDQILRHKFGEAGRKRVEELFSLQAHVQNVQAVYNNLI